jgi:hypothetical protein
LSRLFIEYKIIWGSAGAEVKVVTSRLPALKTAHIMSTYPIASIVIGAAGNQIIHRRHRPVVVLPNRMVKPLGNGYGKRSEPVLSIDSHPITQRLALQVTHDPVG